MYCKQSVFSIPFDVVYYFYFLFHYLLYDMQKWARATSKIAPLPLLALKSNVATAIRYSSSKVARYRYFTMKVAVLPATLNNVKFFLQWLLRNKVYTGIIKKIN